MGQCFPGPKAHFAKGFFRVLLLPADNASAGVTLTWHIDSGDRIVAGYRLHKKVLSPPGADTGWFPLAELPCVDSYYDRSGSPGTHYRLFAVNDLAEEFLLGETKVKTVPPMPGITAWPLPLATGIMNISFTTLGGKGNVAPDDRSHRRRSSSSAKADVLPNHPIKNDARAA